RLEGEIVRDAPVYLGYRVRVAEDLDSALSLSQRPLIGTSRYGEVVSLEKLKKWEVKNGYTLIFGSPLGGISREHWEKFDMFVNFIPNQGTATVRTEEAIMCSLSIMRLVEEKEKEDS
ncbi:MAG: methyltransferase, partial [Archaeoglobi archaeon]|nr:methyltransferase [Archaeoglobi archaeon]